MRRSPQLRSPARKVVHLLVAAMVGGTLAVIAAVTAATPAAALDNGLALTPPMGFNDWNAFGCNVSAALIEQTADAMVADGMKAAGYQYVTMDDCWMAGQDQPRGSAARLSAGRGADGNLVPDPTNFPDGIKAVADYVHARGLKLGIYEDVGTATCQGLAGSYGHEQADARTFAAWGVDYLKYDFCNLPSTTSGEFAGYSTVDMAKVLYGRMRDALGATGRPIVFSMSLAFTTGLEQQTWAADYGNLWRTTIDIRDRWSSVVSIFEQNIRYGQYQKPGAWNDPDMLEVGNGGMTATEYRSHFSLWSIMAAPLIAGTDLRSASAETLATYTNTEVIAVDQDRLGTEGSVLSGDGTHWTVVKPLANGDRAVVLLNTGSTAASQSVAMSKLGFHQANSTYRVRDLWAHETSTVARTLTASVPAHGVAMFRISAHGAGAVSHTSLFGSANPRYLEAGNSGTVTATLTDDAAASLEQVTLTATAPAGWRVSPRRTAPRTVRGTAAATASWKVTVPAGAGPGTAEVTVTARYRNAGSMHTITTPVEVIVPPPPPTSPAYLSDLNWVSTSGTVYRDHSVPASLPGSPGGPPGPITIAATTYPKGLGTQQDSDIQYYLGGHCTSLHAVVGVDDSQFAFGGTTPSARFQVVADGTTVFDQTVAKGTAVTLDQVISGARVVDLVVAPSSGFGAAADWGDAQVTCNSSTKGS